MFADRSGASAIEFAMVAGPLLLMIFGSIEFGRLFWVRQALQETTIAGARCMGVPQTDCSSEGAYSASQTLDFIQDTARGRGIPLSPDDVTIDRDATCTGISGFSRVEIRYRFDSALPGLLTLLAEGSNLRAQACFPNQAGA